MSTPISTPSSPSFQPPSAAVPAARALADDITLEDVSSSQEVKEFTLPRELEDQPPVKIIQFLAEKYSFSTDHIKRLKINPGPFSTAAASLPPNETVDTWSDGDKVYAKINMRYVLEFHDGQRTFKVAFNQPQKTLFEIPFGGTPKEIARFEQKIAAHAFGVRAEIAGPILNKDHERITKLAQKSIFEYSFQYGQINKLKGKETGFNRHIPLEESSKDRDIIGVKVDKDAIIGKKQLRGNFAQKLIQYWFEPTRISEDQISLLWGRPTFAAPKYPALEAYEKARKECQKNALEAYQNASASHQEDAIELVPVPSSTGYSQAYQSLAHYNQGKQNYLKVGPEQLLKQEARSAQDELLSLSHDIQQQISSVKTENAEMKHELAKSSSLYEAQRLKEKIHEQESKMKDKEAHARRNIKFIREALLESIQDPQQIQEINKKFADDAKINREFIYSLYSVKKQIKEQVEQIESSLAGATFLLAFTPKEVKEKYNQMKSLISAIEDLDDFEREQSVVAIRKNMYSKMRANEIKRIDTFKARFQEINRMQATVAELYKEPTLSISQESDKDVQNLRKIRKEVGYTTIPERIRSYEEFVRKTLPPLTSNVEDIELEEKKPDLFIELPQSRSDIHV